MRIASNFARKLVNVLVTIFCVLLVLCTLTIINRLLTRRVAKANFEVDN